MGKRELVLVAVFVALGIGVYQFTAPPSQPGSDVSISGIFSKLRREMRGARETASGEWTQTAPVDPAVRELRVNLSGPNELTVTGEDRADLGIEIHATGRGYDQAE